MAYKAVYNGNSLYHFNPFHDKKNGRFTFKKAYDVLDNAVAKGYDVAEKTLAAFNNQNVKAIQNGSAMVKYMKDLKL